MPKRIHPHNAAFATLLHARHMTIGKLAKQIGLGESHAHLCKVVNGRLAGRRTVGRLKDILPENEWEAVRAFRAAQLGAEIDNFLQQP